MDESAREEIHVFLAKYNSCVPYKGATDRTAITLETSVRAVAGTIPAETFQDLYGPFLFFTPT